MGDNARERDNGLVWLVFGVLMGAVAALVVVGTLNSRVADTLGDVLFGIAVGAGALTLAAGTYAYAHRDAPSNGRLASRESPPVAAQGADG